MKHKAATSIALLCGLLAVGCTRFHETAYRLPWRQASPLPDDAPKLVLMIVVDQLGAQHLTRYNEAFTGGLRRLLDEGVSFTEAHHAHAATETAPGHATIATGCHPSQHGIISNYWLDRATGDEVYSVDDERHDKAPKRLQCGTAGDWLKDRYPKSRVYAMSIKDRSAVLMGGYRADGAYWYGDDGRFVSSSYYPRAEPSWLKELNAEGFLESKFGKVWEPLPFEPELLRKLGVVSFDLGPFEEEFPHTIGGLSLAAGESYFEDLWQSPWLHEYLLELARRVVSAEGLGTGARPDLLAIGFSSTDSVGHEHGPQSREFFDLLVRLDRLLGEFFEFLDQKVGLDQVGIVLTSDHGSVPVPEWRRAQGLPGRRAGVEEVSCLQRVESALDAEYGDARWLLPGPFFAPLPTGSPVSRDELEQRTKELLEACPSVARVWLASQLSREGDDERQRQFARSYFPERSPDLEIEWDEYFLSSRGSASSHGTPHRYDSHVPLVFWRRGQAPGSRTMPVRTVDVAPTVGSWLGLEAPQPVAGRDLTQPLMPPAAPGG